MYDSGNKIGVLKLLDGKYADKPELLWRLARAYYDSAEVRPFCTPCNGTPWFEELCSDILLNLYIHFLLFHSMSYCVSWYHTIYVS